MQKGPAMFDTPSLDPTASAAKDLHSAINESQKTSGDDIEITIVDEKLKELSEFAKADSETTPEPLHEGTVPVVEERVDVNIARTGTRMLAHESDRNGVRLLLLTRDETIAKEGSLSLRRVLALAQAFSEIHIIVLSLRGEQDAPAMRLTDNVWIYYTNSRMWWKTGFDAYHLANEQLTFAGGFRADVILAEDPFESGVVGHYLAKRQGRPLQIHISEDFYDPLFSERDTHNQWRVYMAEFCIKRAQSIRTKSEFLKEEICGEYPKLKKFTEVLPLYHNLEAWRDHVPTFSLKERYPQFKFIILCVSAMQVRSHTAEVILGVAPLLKQYQTIGLVIVGSGPLRTALEKQVIALGIHNQVEFEPVPSEYISHMKSANVLVHLSEDQEEDDVIMAAAAVRLPILSGKRNLGGEILGDGESAYICENTDVDAVTQRINHFLNDNQLRTQFALNAQEVVFERIEQDYDGYLAAYRQSIERALVPDS